MASFLPSFFLFLLFQYLVPNPYVSSPFIFAIVRPRRRSERRGDLPPFLSLYKPSSGMAGGFTPKISYASTLVLTSY